MADSVAVVILKNRKFLLVERKSEQEFYPSFWAPAHGHIKNGETQEEAVRRIVMRTFGTQITSCRYLKTMLSDFSSNSLHWWGADIEDVPIKINPKFVSKYDWLTWTQLMKKNLLPATENMFKTDLKSLVLPENSVGKFITIDGIDASGKNTHTKLLKQWLEGLGYIINLVDFPKYDRHFGRLVGKYLRGEFGSKEELPPEISLLYSLDRYHFAAEIRGMLQRGEWVLADRYTSANIGFHAGKYKEYAERMEMAKWIDLVESRLPQPDIVIILKMDPKISRELHAQRNLKAYMFSGMQRDIHDADLEYQNQVMQTFIEYAEIKENWHTVSCINDASLRSIDDIQKDIRQIVEKQLLPKQR